MVQMSFSCPLGLRFVNSKVLLQQVYKIWTIMWSVTLYSLRWYNS